MRRALATIPVVSLPVAAVSVNQAEAAPTGLTATFSAADNGSWNATLMNAVDGGLR